MAQHETGRPTALPVVRRLVMVALAAAAGSGCLPEPPVVDASGIPVTEPGGTVVSAAGLSEAFGLADGPAACVAGEMAGTEASLDAFTRLSSHPIVAERLEGALDSCGELTTVVRPYLAAIYESEPAADCVVAALGAEGLRIWAVADRSPTSRRGARLLLEPVEDGCGAVALAPAISGAGAAPGDLDGCGLASSNVVASVLVDRDPGFTSVGHADPGPAGVPPPTTCSVSGSLVDTTRVDVVISTFRTVAHASQVDLVDGDTPIVRDPEMTPLPDDAVIGSVPGIDGAPSVWIPDRALPFGISVTDSRTGEPLESVAVELARLVHAALP